MDLIKVDSHSATVKLHLTELQVLAKLRSASVQEAVEATGLGVSTGRMNNMGIEFESLYSLVRRAELSLLDGDDN